MLKTSLHLSLILLLICCLPGFSRAAVIHVSPEGNDGNDGLSEASPLLTLNAAVSLASAGDEIQVAAGSYTPLRAEGHLAGEPARPILIRAKPGEEGDAIIFGDSFNAAAIYLSDASHVVLEGFRLTKGKWGIFLERSNHITIRDCLIDQIGSEGILIESGSSDVQVIDCDIGQTGKSRPIEGEGILIGVGRLDDPDRKPCERILIKGNTIHHTANEAIATKGICEDLVIEDNRIHSVELTRGGAVSLGRANVLAAGQSPSIVRRNRIWRVRTSQNIPEGVGIRSYVSARIYNNVIWDCQDNGIRLDKGLLTQSPADLTVHIYHNTVHRTGRQGILTGSFTGQVKIENNIGFTGGSNTLSDPSFYRDPLVWDFHLVRSATQVIDQGIELEEVTEDIEGTPRPQGAGYDLGAYEYE